MCDFVPSKPTSYKPHAEWIATAQNCERSLSWCNVQLIEQYNHTAHTLRLFLKGQIVSMQHTNNGRWNTTDQVIETLPQNQYRIRVDNFAEPQIPQETQSLCNATGMKKAKHWHCKLQTVERHHNHPCHQAVPTSHPWWRSLGPLGLYLVCTHTARNLLLPKDHERGGDIE